MKENKRYSVVIADDHPIVRKGIRDIVMEDGHFIVVAEIGSGDKVVDTVRKLNPSVLLLDLNMPKLHGLDVIKLLKSEGPPVEIIVMTMHKEEEIVDSVRDLGVKGYLLKESAEDNLIRCIERVLDGDYYLSPELSAYLISRKQRVEASFTKHPELDSLTPSEKQILRLIAQQMTSKEIADNLCVSVFTINNHRNNICRKLNLHGINGLLKYAIENKPSF